MHGLAQRGVPSKPYFPAVHLMSFYRERFGYREGEFPVCEDVAARSLALPFFSQMRESQVEVVACALADAIESASRSLRPRAAARSADRSAAPEP